MHFLKLRRTTRGPTSPLFVCALFLLFACRFSGISPEFDIVPDTTPEESSDLSAETDGSIVLDAVSSGAGQATRYVLADIYNQVSARPLNEGSGGVDRFENRPLPFGQWAPVGVAQPAAVPNYRFDLAQLRNPAVLTELGLTPAENEALATSGFVLLSGRAATPAEAFDAIARAGQPALISTDIVLAYTFDAQRAALSLSEQAYTDAYLRMMVEEMLAETSSIWETYAEGGTAGIEPETAPYLVAAHRNLAFFGVAARLLSLPAPLPPEVEETVAAELALIEAGETFVSPLINRTVDYSRMATADAGLSRAKMWLETDFLLWDRLNLAEVRIAAAQIEQLLTIWESGNGDTWQNLFAFFAYQQGEGSVSIGEWQNIEEGSQTLEQFAAALVNLEQSDFPLLPSGPGRSAMIFEATSYNRVGPYQGDGQSLPKTGVITEFGVVRAAPHPFDVALAFGSGSAREGLTLSGDIQYANYESQIGSFQPELSRFSGRVPTTLEDGHLLALLGLALPADPTTPPFMRSAAWPSRQLDQWQTGFLLSHAVRRSEQGFTAAPLSFQPTELYLAPHPHLYATLATQTRQIATGLATTNRLNQATLDQLLGLEQTLLFLKSVAEKGIETVPLSPQERDRLGSFLSEAGALTPPSSIEIFTNTVTGEPIHYTRGGVDLLVIYTLLNDRPTLVYGPVWSYE